MSDAPLSMPGGTFSNAKRMTDGSGDRVAEQVGAEAERLAETIDDGMEAVRTASKTYGSAFTDAYVRMIRVAMRNGTAMGDHLIALAQVRNPADAVKLNLEFGQRQMSSMQQRLFEICGVKGDENTKA